MVQVKLRNFGDGLWRTLLAPASVAAAETIAAAAKKLNLADQVSIEPSAPRLIGRAIDLRI